ncbi:MAG: aldo/keto reductase [Gammaproteobacteria bacterium]|nr:aldo/keto reductase [Gammaproteobacteria bacterium]
MRTFQLNAIDVPASVIGLGTMIFHPDTRDRDFALLDAYTAAGGTYIDTAEVYGAVEEHGHSETVIGEWLAARPGMRARIVLASKGLIPGYCAPLHPGGASIGPEQIHRAIDGSLARLQSDSMDIWMFHRDDPKLAVAPLVDALDEEIRRGRIRAWGASNWTAARLQQAMDYAASAGKARPVASSPHFSLARANEPYWPDTVVTDAADRAWFASANMPLVAWSSLGRGFFAHGVEGDRSDAELVRVFYSADNFARKKRLTEFAAARGRSIFELALAWVTNQEFPVVALCGPQTVDEVADCMRAGDLRLSAAERDWLDLATEARPF